MERRLVSASALEQLEELRGRVTEAKRRVEELDLEQKKLARQVEAAKEPLRAYYEAIGAGDRPRDQAEEKRLAAEAAKAEDPIAKDRTAALHAGATRAVQERENEVATFIVSNQKPLTRELVERSVAAREELFAGLAAFDAGVGAWSTVRNQWLSMIERWDMSPAEVPRNPLGQALDRTPLAPFASGVARDPRRLYPMPVSLAPVEEAP